MCWPEKWQAQRLGTSYLRTTGIRGEWQPLCRAGSTYHIIPPYLLHKTIARNLLYGEGGTKFPKVLAEMKEKHRVSYGFASTVWGLRCRFWKKNPLPKDKYPSVFYMVDGRLETILDVANKISKKISPFHIFGRSSLHIQMIIIASK